MRDDYWEGWCADVDRYMDNVGIPGLIQAWVEARLTITTRIQLYRLSHSTEMAYVRGWEDFAIALRGCGLPSMNWTVLSIWAYLPEKHHADFAVLAAEGISKETQYRAERAAGAMRYAPEVYRLSVARIKDFGKRGPHNPLEIDEWHEVLRNYPGGFERLLLGAPVPGGPAGGAAEVPGRAGVRSRPLPPVPSLPPPEPARSEPAKPEATRRGKPEEPFKGLRLLKGGKDDETKA